MHLKYAYYYRINFLYKLKGQAHEKEEGKYKLLKPRKVKW